MARLKTRAKLFFGCNVLDLCPNCESGDLDTAMLDAEKASRISLWVLMGMLKDYKGSVIDDEALEVVRQVIWAADSKIRDAIELYWKQREAPKQGDTPEATGPNVVALPKRKDGGAA